MFLTTKYKVISNLYIKHVTCVKMTPVAETIVEFYKIAQFSLKTTPFYRKLPPFYKKLRTPSLQKTPSLISAFIENSIFGNNRDPCAGPPYMNQEGNGGLRSVTHTTLDGRRGSKVLARQQTAIQPYPIHFYTYHTVYLLNIIHMKRLLAQDKTDEC